MLLQRAAWAGVQLRPAGDSCSRKPSPWAPGQSAGCPVGGASSLCRPQAARSPCRARRRRNAATVAVYSTSEAETLIQEFSVQHELPHGRLTIRPVHADDVGAAAVLLTRAFAGSAQGVPLSDGRQYCLDSLQQPPRGVLLVARLHPEDETLLPPGQSSRLVATTGLSFCRTTREAFPTLQPPDEEAYLANMAVDAKLRRQGHARLMLAAAEALAAARGFSTIWLHARLADAAAQQLYLSSGYAVVEQDNALLAKVRGITPRALMRKQL